MDNNKKAVCWLSFAHGISDVYSGFLTPLMPFIAAKIGFSLAIAAMITSISQAISSLIQPLFGYLADVNTKRFFIFWGLILGSLSNPIAANTNNIFLLCFFVVLGNLGGSFFHPQALGLVPRFSDKNSIYNMSIFVTSGTIGFSMGPLITSSVVQLLGYPYLLLTSLAGLFMAFLMFKCVPKMTSSNSKLKENLVTALKNIVFNKTMLILITIGLMKTLIQSSCSIMMPFLWKDLGYTPMYIGFGMFLFLFAGGLGSFFSHWFEKKFGAKFVFYASMTITLPLMIVYGNTYKAYPVFSLIIFIVVGFLTTFAQPITLIMAQEVLPQYKSIVSGIINGFTWGIVALMLIWLGYVAEKFGIMNILIVLSILPALTSFLVSYLPNRADN